MNSLELKEFSGAIENFINSKAYPSELVRVVLLNILHNVEEKANAETMMQLKERQTKESEVNENGN